MTILLACHPGLLIAQLGVVCKHLRKTARLFVALLTSRFHVWQQVIKETALLMHVPEVHLVTILLACPNLALPFPDFWAYTQGLQVSFL